MISLPAAVEVPAAGLPGSAGDQCQANTVSVMTAPQQDAELQAANRDYRDRRICTIAWHMIIAYSVMPRPGRAV